MQRYKILWADDEIDLLKPHIMFLESRGYDVVPVHSGADAIEQVNDNTFDIIFLDENMPGMSGLETLGEIKSARPAIPVVMITKSEEEHIMEEAIGAKIADYLIKPLNPNQILLSVKKILQNKQLISEKTNIGYQQDFRNISMMYNDRIDYQEWADIYKKLIYWELEIDSAENKSMKEILEMQKSEANANFSKFLMGEYEDWLNHPKADAPLMSHQLLKEKVFPYLKEKEKPVFLVVIDNLRFDQWKVLENQVGESFKILQEEAYYSILPTTTSHSRNAIFSGMMPSEMEKKHSDWWVHEDEEQPMNNHEEDFLRANLKRNNLDVRLSYSKVTNTGAGKNLVENIPNMMTNDLNVIVYNFVDMMSHARTDTQMIRELAPDESAYRSLTRSWFQHSPLLDALKQIADTDVKLFITTDHGTIRVKKPFKIIGDRNVNTNLRYKVGKNLSFEEQNVFVCRKPERFFLPKRNVSSAYVFAIDDYFFAYPNNYNYYANYYRDTFQHGGVSMEEVIVPFISLESK